jgi:hypothetical protein
MFKRPFEIIPASKWEYLFLSTPTAEAMAAGSIHCEQLQRTDASKLLPEHLASDRTSPQRKCSSSHR